MDRYLDDRFANENSALNGIPTVQEVSDQLKISPRFLTDMLKSLTGMGTQQHIHNRLIEKAKEILTCGNASIAEIAYRLGFEHPQSFNNCLKRSPAPPLGNSGNYSIN